VQMIFPPEQDENVLAGWAVSVLVVSGIAGGGLAARRLAALGAKVEVQAGLCGALVRLAAGGNIDLLVIDCDHAGGVDAGRGAFECLVRAGLRMPVMLISSDCAEQTFPLRQEAPCHLRAPVSAVALRIGLEVAFAGATVA